LGQVFIGSACDPSHRFLASLSAEITEALLMAGGGQYGTGTGRGEALLPGNKPNQERPVHEVLVLGVLIPFIFFCLLIYEFTFLYHIVPLAPWFTVFLGVVFAFMRAYPKYPGQHGYPPWSWYPLSACLFAVGAGILFGLLNYDQALPWIHSTALREYTAVRPEMDPRALQDAGTLRFAIGSTVDVESSAGYKVWPTTYCAAPIVGVNPSDQVSFWAVGVNCCESRQSFSCGDVLEPEARSGLKLETHALGKLIGQDAFQNYRRAAEMVAGVYGLKMAPEPIFVEWVLDPVVAAEKAWWRATICALIVVVVAAFFAAIAAGHIHSGKMRHR